MIFLDMSRHPRMVKLAEKSSIWDPADPPNLGLGAWVPKDCFFHDFLDMSRTPRVANLAEKSQVWDLQTPRILGLGA